MATKNDDRWIQIQQKVSSINNLGTSEERANAFRSIVSILGDTVYRIGYHDYPTYAKHAYEIWENLNPSYVEELFPIIKSYDGGYESHDYVRAFAPAVVFLRPDLLPKLIEHIEQPYIQLKAIQYSNLALYFTGREQLEFLQKSIAAFKYAENSDYIIPQILTTVADYATPALIPYVLRWLAEYPASEPLGQLAEKIVNNEAWLEQAFAIAKTINASTHKFICGVAPDVSAEWIKRLFLYIIERKKVEEQEDSHGCLTKRLIDLINEGQKDEVYRAWCEINHVISEYPRQQALEYLSWFAEIIVLLGEDQTAEKSVTAALQTCTWWSMKWVKPRRRWVSSG